MLFLFWGGGGGGGVGGWRLDGGGEMFSAIFHMRDLLLLPVMLIPIGPSPPEKRSTLKGKNSQKIL